MHPYYRVRVFDAVSRTLVLSDIVTCLSDVADTRAAYGRDRGYRIRVKPIRRNHTRNGR